MAPSEQQRGIVFTDTNTADSAPTGGALKLSPKEIKEYNGLRRRAKALFQRLLLSKNPQAKKNMGDTIMGMSKRMNEILAKYSKPKLELA